jgi:hypothetical protein
MGHGVIKITLQVVVDDLLGGRWDNQGVAIMPTRIPSNRDVRKMLRRRISNNDFEFHLLLSRIPLRGKKRPVYVPLAMKDYRLIETKDAWYVETEWMFSDSRTKENEEDGIAFPRSIVDDPQLLSDLFSQLSDGWGEGVSQFSFGPCVRCEDTEEKKCVLDRPFREYNESDGDYSVMGQFMFNLTAIGIRIH